MQNHTILTSRLSMDSDIPLYTQLVGIIKQNISSGELGVGDLLPSEAELCRTMGISRNTLGHHSRLHRVELAFDILSLGNRSSNTYKYEQQKYSLHFSSFDSLCINSEDLKLLSVDD